MRLRRCASWVVWYRVVVRASRRRASWEMSWKLMVLTLYCVWRCRLLLLIGCSMRSKRLAWCRNAELRQLLIGTPTCCLFTRWEVANRLLVMLVGRVRG